MHNRLLLISTTVAVGVAFCLVGCSVVDVEQKCKDQALIGLKQQQARQFAEAEQTYLTASALAKTSANALQYPLMLRELSRSYVAQKKFAQAELSLQQAVDCYEELAKKAKSTRFDQSLVDEREYETLASLGEVCMAQNKDMEAKIAFAKAIALGQKIVEPPTISQSVNQSYIKVLAKTGDQYLAEQLQRRLDASALTSSEFDGRFSTAQLLLYKGDYAGAEKQFDTLQLAAQGFVGNNSRAGRAKTYVSLFKIIRNSPLEAELFLSDATRLLPRDSENLTEICYAYTLLGLCEEMRGDAKSSIGWYRKAFATAPFAPSQILITAREGLLKFGHPQQAQIVMQRIKLFQEDPQFQKAPVTALDYVMLARQHMVLNQTALAKESRLQGLLHLEQHSDASKQTEMRGAFQLYKSYLADHEKELSVRALKQVYAVGGRSPEGQQKLRKIIEIEHLTRSQP